MGEPERMHFGGAASAVVQPLSRVAQRPCARPACPAPARSTLSFSYARKEAWLDSLSDARDSQAYDLCVTHASRTRAPYGWRLRDRRSEEDRRTDAPPVMPVDLGTERTVAVLAAALRAAPTAVPENGGGLRLSEIDHARGDGDAGGGSHLRPTASAPAGATSPPDDPTDAGSRIDRRRMAEQLARDRAGPITLTAVPDAVEPADDGAPDDGGVPAVAVGVATGESAGTTATGAAISPANGTTAGAAGASSSDDAVVASSRRPSRDAVTVTPLVEAGFATDW